MAGSSGDRAMAGSSGGVSRRRGLMPWVVVWVLLALLLVGLRFGRSHLTPTVERFDQRPIQAPEREFVQSSSCRSCHPHEYATWHGSYHRTMTQAATPEAVVGDFRNVTLEFGGRTYRLFRRGDTFWAEMDDPLWEGAGPAPRVERPIVMTTGSHHLQVYWFSLGRGREVAQLPFDYRIPEKEWMPDHMTFVRPPWPKGVQIPVAAPGMWDVGCIRCHTTEGHPRVGWTEEGYSDSRVTEFGIACEACHGPGEAHVAANRNPKRRYGLHRSGGQDDTMVHPGRLSHRRSAQVCGQCHSVQHFLSEEQRAAWMQRGTGYRPGTELDERTFVVQPTVHGDDPRLLERLSHDPTFVEESFWPDGMVRVTGREYNALLETPCFQRGEMSCLSCHVMHKPARDARTIREWANDQLAAGMDGDRACLQCHPSYGRDVSKHTHHAAESSGSRCYNCHMPYTTYGLHKAIRSHQVDSPTVQASLQTGRPNACNQCHLDKTLAWAAEHLHSWYGVPRPELTGEERTVAASILWALRGDAGQRALMAWSFGWAEARKASGTEWMAPLLAQLLVDPYGAVRYVAHQSVKTLAGFEGMTFDLSDAAAEKQTAAIQCINLWRRTYAAKAAQRGDREALLIQSDGNLDGAKFKRLVSERDHRPLTLRE